MYQLSVATIMLRKLNGIKYKTYIFAAKSTGWLEFCCFGLGWAGLTWEGLMNVCGKLRGLLEAGCSALLHQARLAYSCGWGRAPRESGPCWTSSLAQMLLAKASQKASSDSRRRETDSTCWWEKVQSHSASMLPSPSGKKTIQAVGHRHVLLMPSNYWRTEIRHGSWMSFRQLKSPVFGKW